MYIGSTDIHGLHHLDLRSGRQQRRRGDGRATAPSIDVVISATTGACSVTDDGRGIPVDTHLTQHRPGGPSVVTDDAPCRREVRRSKSYRVLGRPPRRRRLRRERALRSSRGGDAAATAANYFAALRAGVPAADLADRGPDRRPHGTMVTFHPDADHLREIMSSSFDIADAAAARARLPRTGASRSRSTDERATRKASEFPVTRAAS
ncbi:MAG: hypothetical protein MZU79_03210 [Anaerotruncus sp.]|nr:hypothetical protein [Anaerotruncus sp.]